MKEKILKKRVSLGNLIRLNSIFYRGKKSDIQS